LQSIAALGTIALLASCGGGDGGTTPVTTVFTTPTQVVEPARSSAAIAAAAVANSSTNDCADVRPFYWEIGNGAQRLASGSVNAAGNPTTVASDTSLSIASASKWLYSSYVAQRKSGVLDATDIKMLTLRSGYTTFSDCQPTQTVDECLADGLNDRHSVLTDDRFFYGGGHMEKHASMIGLGGMGNAALADALRGQLGNDIEFSFNQPLLAGGIQTNADNYARFLRKILNNQLRISALLGTSSVCTNPDTCPAGQAIYTPSPPAQSWHYSIGHWVEDDPVVGDGSFSSAGAFGFYPWIDSGKTTYGIVAREALGGTLGSIACGKLIRSAWMAAAKG